MRAEAARAILQANNLIDRHTSQKILAAITTNTELDVSPIPCPTLRRKIALLQHQYWETVHALGGKPQPRNLPFYVMIKAQYPQFHWEQIQAKALRIDLYCHGLKPSLLSLLLSLIPEHETSRYRQLQARFPTQDAAVLTACLEVFTQEDVVTPSDADLMRLLGWIRRGQAGQRVTIVSPVCPDYATMAGARKAHRFTFDGLGTGSGVTAGRLLKSLPALHHLFTATLGLTQLTHRVCVGDFEAFVPETVRRVGLDEATFVARVRASCRAIAQQAPTPVIAHPFTDLCGGKCGWLTQHAAVTARFQAHEFGAVRGNPRFQAIARARQALYDRWFQVENQPLDFYEDLVVRQGSEYTTMGTIVAESRVCPNPLLLGADHDKMAPFYTFAADLPVVYLRRNYE